MATGWTRRAVLMGAAAGPALMVRPSRAADYTFAQYHNQAAEGTLHRNLTAMWQAVRSETNGRVETTVYAENNKLPGGDPVALKMLIAGEIQFFTLMGGIIGTVAPVAEAQQLPFAFKTAAEAHKAIDGPFGQYIGQEMAAKGMYLFPVAGFDNGMRQVAAIPRPIARPEDFAGMKIRVPPGQMMLDTFGAFGAEPVTTPANLIYESLKTGKVEAQSAGDRAGFQALRTGQVCQHDQPHVVGLQRHGASRHLERAAGRHQGHHHPQCRQLRWPATPGPGRAERRVARRFRQARPGVQRGRSGRLPRPAARRLRGLEGKTRIEMLVAARGRGGEAGLGLCGVINHRRHPRARGDPVSQSVSIRSRPLWDTGSPG
jgi:hypothetical protein